MKTPDQIRDLLRDRLFGQNIVQNNFRGELVEEIVASVICPPWRHCSEDWSSWDFQRDRHLVQIKQTAARQSWDKATEPLPKRKAIFSIRPNTGYYIGSKWEPLKPARRLAQIYIFAWHDDATPEANHYDFQRWKFYVVPTETLNGLDRKEPKQSIGVVELEAVCASAKAKKVGLDGLPYALEGLTSLETDIDPNKN